jgi:hypothetical protein
VDAAGAGADEYRHGEVIDRPLLELSRPRGSSFTSSFRYLPLYAQTQTSPKNSHSVSTDPHPWQLLHLKINYSPMSGKISVRIGFREILR